MLPEDIARKVRGIELRTRRLVNEVFGGEYHSVFKGRGIEFAEVREYGIGDDIRLIDWNVTARMGSPYIKTYEEERELTVMLVVDASGSGLFGTRGMFKGELAAEVSAVLAFSAIKNNDRVGLIMFTDRIETYIPPAKGKKHVLRVIREILSFTPEGKRTDVRSAIEHANAMLKRRAIVFLISDFLDTGYETALRVTARKHDTIALVIDDEREELLSDSGIVAFEDAENGEIVHVDTSSRQVRRKYWLFRKQQRQEFNEFLNRSGIDRIALRTGIPYDEALIRFFKQRIRHFR